MTKEGSQVLLALMRSYYPRSFYGIKTEEDIRLRLEDYEESFAKWTDSEVVQVLKDWHIEHPEAPTIADMVRELKIRAIEKKPAKPLAEEKPKETFSTNPWEKALNRCIKEHRKNPNDPHNFLYYIITEYGYAEYKRAKEAFLNAKNRRTDENRRLGITDDVVEIPTEATFADEEDKTLIKQLIREGKL